MLRHVLSASALLCACGDVDELLGASDHEVLAVSIANEQPTNPDHGVLVTINVFVVKDRLLDVAVRSGTFQRQQFPTGETAFCELAKTGTSSLVPLLVHPDDDEAILEVRLLEGTDTTKCAGPILDSLVVPIAARPRPTTVDAGVVDAGAVDAI